MKVPNTTTPGESNHNTRECDCGVCDHARRKLWEYVEKFVADNEVSCEESVYQVDSIQENALEFTADCCSIVGFHEPKD